MKQESTLSEKNPTPGEKSKIKTYTPGFQPGVMGVDHQICGKHRKTFLAENKHAAKKQYYQFTPANQSVTLYSGTLAKQIQEILPESRYNKYILSLNIFYTFVIYKNNIYDT